MGQRHHSDGSKDYLERLAPQAGVRAVMMDHNGDAYWTQAEHMECADQG